MSEKRDLNLFFEDIFQVIDKINGYVKGIESAKELKDHEQVYDAVIMNFIIIGEAVKNIFEQVQKDYPEIEWKDIMAMRNILVHEYWGINDIVVWNTIKNDLPELQKILKKIKSQL